MTNIIEAKVQNAPPPYNFQYLEIRFNGSLDKTTASQVDHFLQNIKTYHQGKIVLLLSNITGVDSTGIALLANFNEEFRKEGSLVYFVDVPKKILQLFEMLGLIEFFQIFANIEESMASLSSNEKMPTSAQQNIGKSSEAEEGEVSPTTDKKVLTEKKAEPKQGKSTPVPDNGPEEEKFSHEESEKKRLRTIKIKKNSDVASGEQQAARFFTIQVEYYHKMICHYNFPFRVSIIAHGEKKEKNFWKIIPKIPSCIVIPGEIDVAETQFSLDFCFSVTPLTPSKIPAEIVMITPSGILRQFAIKLKIARLTIPLIFWTSGILLFIFSWITEIFEIPYKKTNSVWIQGLQILISEFIGSPFLAFLLGSLLFLIGLIYYHWYVRSQKGSLQIHFYEK